MSYRSESPLSPLREMASSGAAAPDSPEERAALLLQRRAPPVDFDDRRLLALGYRGRSRPPRLARHLLRLSVWALAVVVTVNLAIAASFYGLSHWRSRFRELELGPPVTRPLVPPAPVVVSRSASSIAEPPGEVRSTSAIRSPRPAHRSSLDLASLDLARGPSTVFPQRLEPQPQPLEGDPLGAESLALAEALRQLHHDRDPAGALASLVIYAHRFPQGKLAGLAAATEVEARLALGQHAEALSVLDHLGDLGIEKLSRGREFEVLRGELLSEDGRCPEAIRAFGRSLGEAMDEGLTQRALYGKAACESRTGQVAAARSDLGSYLSKFPDGDFAPQAHRALFGAPR